MKKSYIFGIGLLILIVCFTILSILKYIHRNNIFQFTVIETGDIKNTITSTGILYPKSKVEVGTQISGTFKKIYVDYNQVVEKGQLLAELDKQLLQANYEEAQAILVNSKEKYEFSKTDYLQKKQLYESGFLSKIDYYKAQSVYTIDSSSYLSAQAELKKAGINLGYSSIVSPISGTIIEKNVETGQTVAANFNTPTLFVIAEDLSKMEIHATVDESDISYIYKGQNIEFSVTAYPDSVFTGEVSQIRLRPNVVQNIVNYIVVIYTSNKRGLLLPGMTATVNFIINQKKNILMVSKNSLNFIPPKDMVEKYQRLMIRNKQQGSYSSAGESENITNSDHIAHLWYLGQNGDLAMETIETGEADDKNIEIVHSKNLKNGMQIICGIAETSGTKQNDSSNKTQIFNNQQNNSGPPPPQGGM